MLPKIEVVSLRCVYQDGRHNAFTDLARFRGDYYLAFRNCPDGHMLYTSSRILVMRSGDGVDWQPVCAFGAPGRDVRDPHLLVFGDRLFVYSGTWVAGPRAPALRDMNDHLGYAAWTDDGAQWHGPQTMETTRGHYIWRAAAYGGRAYLCGRRKRGFMPTSSHEEEMAVTEAALLASDDGLHWETAALLRPTYGDETAFLFEADGTLVGLCRGREGYAPAQIIRASPPYADWRRTDLPRNVGGPLLARWGAWADGAPRYLAAGRDRSDPQRPLTKLHWVVEDSLVEALTLPSGGDTSYPGFVALSDERALLSYYSSHEARNPALPSASIYLAELALE